MVTVGVRELKQQTSELIRLVLETGSGIEITYHPNYTRDHECNL